MGNIVAFIGRAGSGKGYQCDILKQQGYQELAFADILREIAFQTLGMDYDWGMRHYDNLKRTELYNGLTFRNILENLGSAIREYDSKFFVQSVMSRINSNPDANYCISDLRYLNEALALHNTFGFDNLKFVFCDYHSDRYQEYNEHESAMLSNALCECGYSDLQELTIVDLIRANKHYCLQKMTEFTEELELYTEDVTC